MMSVYHLAPRDIVARAIDSEMKISGDDFVLLDCTQLDQEKFYDHFPNITDKCRSIGIDPFVNMVPVVPACHYTCGGIVIDKEGRTSVTNLFAAGEVTASGLHGANRLASNSLLEGLVYGHNIQEVIVKEIDNSRIKSDVPEWNAEGTTDPNELVLLTQSWKRTQRNNE